MEYIKLDKKAITSWRIGRTISFVILLIVCAAVYIGEGFLKVLEPYHWLISAVLGLLLIYKLAGIFLYPLIEYRQWGYYITEDKVEIRHGIFFVTNTVIPIIRIQHITVSQGPINRRLGLYQVKMSLASDSFAIECLSREVADEIAENLKSKLYIRLGEQDKMEVKR